MFLRPSPPRRSVRGVTHGEGVGPFCIRSRSSCSSSATRARNSPASTTPLADPSIGVESIELAAAPLGLEELDPGRVFSGQAQSGLSGDEGEEERVGIGAHRLDENGPSTTGLRIVADTSGVYTNRYPA